MGTLHTDPGQTNNPAYPVSETAFATYPHIPWHTYTEIVEEDFAGPLISNGARYGPYVVTNNSAGTPTYAVGTATANNPGVMLTTSAAVANTGNTILTAATQIMPGGGESTEIVFSLGITATFAGYLGFLVSTPTAYAQPTIGAWLNIAAAVVTGVCGNVSITSTATSYTITQATWYRAIITNNAANTLWTFSLYQCSSGVRLWTDTVQGANIPAQLLGHGIVQSNSGASAVALLSIDYMTINIARALVR